MSRRPAPPTTPPAWHRFDPAALRFLGQLRRNNRRDWFEAHRGEYEALVKQPLRALVEEIDVLLARVMPELRGDPARSVFRIHRDVRFSGPPRTGCLAGGGRDLDAVQAIARLDPRSTARPDRPVRPDHGATDAPPPDQPAQRRGNAGVAAVRPKRAQRAATALAVAVMLLFTIRLVARVAVWRTPERFFRALTADAPRVYRAWYVSGLDARSRGDIGSAERLMRHSLTLWDRNPAVHEALGQLLRREGRCVDAVPVFTAGLTMDPERTQLRAKLGECLLQVGDSAQAAVIAQQGIALGQDAFEGLLKRSGR